MGLFGSAFDWVTAKIAGHSLEVEKKKVEDALNSGLNDINKVYRDYYWLGSRDNKTIFFTVMDELIDLEDKLSLVWDNEDPNRATLSYDLGKGSNANARLVCDPEDCEVNNVESITEAEHIDEFASVIKKGMNEQKANLKKEMRGIQEAKAREAVGGERLR